MSWILSSKEGIIEVGAVDQLDQRFHVQDRQYLFAKFNVDEMKKDIERRIGEENDHSYHYYHVLLLAFLIGSICHKKKY